MNTEQTYWNGYPAPARKVRVIVGKSLRPTWWCAKLEGQERNAVEVYGDGEKIYLDNEDGNGWLKVTRGRGSPDYGHAELPVARVIALAGEAATAAETTQIGSVHEHATAQPERPKATPILPNKERTS